MSGSYIYFAQAVSGGPIKIGYSADPITRIRSLGTGSQGRLRLLAMFPGQKADEWRLHDGLDEHRVNGEWFEDCDEVHASMALDRYLEKFVDQLDSP